MMHRGLRAPSFPSLVPGRANLFPQPPEDFSLFLFTCRDAYVNETFIFDLLLAGRCSFQRDRTVTTVLLGPREVISAAAEFIL